MFLPTILDSESCYSTHLKVSYGHEKARSKTKVLLIHFDFKTYGSVPICSFHIYLDTKHVKDGEHAWFTELEPV